MPIDAEGVAEVVGMLRHPSKISAALEQISLRGLSRSRVVKEALYKAFTRPGDRDFVFMTMEVAGELGIRVADIYAEDRDLLSDGDGAMVKLPNYKLLVHGAVAETNLDVCRFRAKSRSHELSGFCGRRLLLDMILSPRTALPSPKIPLSIWRARYIERFVKEVRRIGLKAPPISHSLGEDELGISHGDQADRIRRFGPHSSVARFRVVHRGLVYRCRFVRHHSSFDYVECDPRFATAPSGSRRYTMPPRTDWAYRTKIQDIHHPPAITWLSEPFSFFVRHVETQGTGLVLQTPYDLLEGIRSFTAAWKAGWQPTGEAFMATLGSLGMDTGPGDMNARPTKAGGTGMFARVEPNRWSLRFDQWMFSADISFEQADKGVVAVVQFLHRWQKYSHRGVVRVHTPRRLYQLIRDTFWDGNDGRKRYQGNGMNWIAAMREAIPVDDGVG